MEHISPMMSGSMITWTLGGIFLIILFIVVIIKLWKK